MGNSIFSPCPYQAEDGFNDRNRYPKGSLFVGEIENGKRYPFGVYTKEESDEQLDALREAVEGKADETETEEIRARLDALEYKPIEITDIAITPSISELGKTETVTITWTLSKDAVSQNINGIPVTGNIKQFTGVSASKQYDLTASDGQTSDTKSVGIEFANRVYYGAAANLSNVTSLQYVLSNDRKREITVTAGEGQYIVYAVPIRLGQCIFYAGGFEGGFEDPELQTLVNGNGYAEQYYVYRSTNTNLGETTVEVR